MKKENTIVNFNNELFEIELKKLNDNLEIYIQLEQSFEKITGSIEIKTIDYLNTFITSLSKFPNVEASVKLLDFETDYNFIVKNIYAVDISLIDLESKTVLKSLVDELNESCTYRLNDKTEIDYDLLKKIADLYSKLSNIQMLSSISSVDYINYNVDVMRINYISQIR